MTDDKGWKIRRKGLDPKKVAQDEKLLDNLGAAIRKTEDELKNLTRTEKLLRAMLDAWKSDVDSVDIPPAKIDKTKKDLKRTARERARTEAKVRKLRKEKLKIQRKK